MCCSIYRIPSSPIGYADDIASCCSTKTKIDKVLDIAYKHSCVWRYNFNPKKCAVLVYGETRDEHDRNVSQRVFKLGPHRIKEKTEYEHVGVKACVYMQDECVIEDRLSKARKTFNALTGLGIRRNGLTIAVCNIIYWTVVIPTLTYGCELWILSLADIRNLKFLQRYVARRIQRLPQRCPKECCTYGLGWIDIERVIYVKKLLFIHTILAMDRQEIVRMIFVEKFNSYLNDPENAAENRYGSPIYDMLSVSVSFGLFDSVRHYVNTGSLPPKKAWSNKVWSKAWSLNDGFEFCEVNINEGTTLLHKVMGQTQYVSWWELSDAKPTLMWMCETMVKILCHSSQLREDDYNLRGKLLNYKVCPHCDLGVFESINHVIMQCPANEEARRVMFDRILQIDDGTGRYALDNCDNVFNLILGSRIKGLSNEQLYPIWEITGEVVTRIYWNIVRDRSGVG